MIGWRCPGCGRCYSPSVAMCVSCVPPATSTSTTPLKQVPICVPSNWPVQETKAAPRSDPPVHRGGGYYASDEGGIGERE